MINIKKNKKKFGRLNNKYYFCPVKKKTITLTHTEIMKTVTFTMQEIWAASRPSVQKSKKVYERKPKHNKDKY